MSQIVVPHQDEICCPALSVLYATKDVNSIDIIRAGRESYYTQLGKDDYYTGQPNPEGLFLGSGAESLGLLGHRITKEDPVLKYLFQGLTPDGSKALRQGMHTVREYYTLENPETGRTVQDTSSRVFYLRSDEVKAIQSGKPEGYSDRLRAFCKEHQHHFVDGTITPDWVQAQGKKNPRYTLQNPDTKEIHHTQAPRVAYLNQFEVAQLRHGDPNQYNKRLTRLISEHKIDNPNQWVKLTTRRSVVAYDNVFSAPKDVSILWSLSPDDKTRQQVLSIHEQATRKAISYLEQQAWVRKGKGGTKIEAAKATFAVFTHTTSRDLDPQLHSHVVMLNFGITEDGGSGALNGKAILDARYAAGMIYQNELRRGLEHRFGVATYDQPFQRGIGASFGISGISQGIKDTFSKRTHAINQRINPGMSGKERRVEKLKSRKAKDPNVSAAALLKEWQGEGKAQGFSWRSVVGKTRPQKPLTTKKDYQLFYREVTKQIYAKERQGTVSNHQVVAMVLSASRGRLDSEQALAIASGIKGHFLMAHDQTHGKVAYSLNKKGHQAMGYRTAFERVQDMLKGLKKAYYQNRLAVLYATGKISGKQYRKFTEGKGLPKSVIGIRVHQAVGLISKRQADYLVYKKRAPKFKPKINHAPIVKITTFKDARKGNVCEWER